MRRRTVLTGVLVWALVVVAVSAVTWAVIDAAGQDLLAGNSLVTDAAPAVPSASAASPSPSASPHPRRSRHPRSATSDGASTSPSPRATSAPRSAAPTRTSPKTVASSTTAAGRARTWEGPPGVVSVRCEGARISLLSASPSNGYRIEVEKHADEIEVHFKSSTREYQVKARCSAGTPRFEVESGGEGGDD